MIECQSCRRELPVTEEWVGKIIVCNGCDQRYKVTISVVKNPKTGHVVRSIELDPIQMSYHSPY